MVPSSEGRGGPFERGTPHTLHRFPSQGGISPASRTLAFRGGRTSVEHYLGGKCPCLQRAPPMGVPVRTPPRLFGVSRTLPPPGEACILVRSRYTGSNPPCHCSSSGCRRAAKCRTQLWGPGRRPAPWGAPLGGRQEAGPEIRCTLPRIRPGTVLPPSGFGPVGSGIAAAGRQWDRSRR